MDSNEDSIQLNVTKFDLDTRKGSWRFVSIFIWAGSGLAGLAMLADSFPKAVNFFGVFLLLLCAISIIPLFVFLIVEIKWILLKSWRILKNLLYQRIVFGPL